MRLAVLGNFANTLFDPISMDIISLTGDAVGITVERKIRP